MKDPLVPFEVLATNDIWRDPAINMSDPPEGTDAPTAVERLARYRETRDIAELVLSSTQAPTFFVCSPIAAAFAGYNLRGLLPHVRDMLAFLASCHEIRQPNGQTLKPKKLETTAYGQPVASEREWVGTVAAEYGLETVLEIGRVAYEKARLPTKARGPFFYVGG